jgi:hypothetical protein
MTDTHPVRRRARAQHSAGAPARLAAGLLGALGAVAAVLAPPPAAAGDGDAYAALSTGAAYRYAFGSGGDIVMRLEQKSAAGTIWSIIPGVDPGGEVAAKMVHDPQGRLTAYLTPDGEAMEVYEPHNCERVELVCRYTMTDAEGDHREQRFSELDGEEWSYSVLRFDDGAFEGRRLGSVRYDADGVVVEESWADLATAGEESVTRVE